MTIEEYKFDAAQFVSSKVNEIRESFGSERCLVAISGGVDSTTCAVLMHRALGENLDCVFIDTGFMREGESDSVREMLTRAPLNISLRIVEAKERFLKALNGVTEAEEKRKIFRDLFYTILGEEVKRAGVRSLAQGTIAPDWIETSGGIKSQHNVLEQIGIDTKGRYGFRVIEPLAELYKDQVRILAEALEIPTAVSTRQPFPGPGLLVRVVGGVTKPKLNTTRKACRIFELNVEKSGVSSEQYFAGTIDSSILSKPDEDNRSLIAGLLREREMSYSILAARVTGVKGDLRAYGRVGIIGLPLNSRRTWIENLPSLVELGGKLVSNTPEVTRVLFLIRESEHGGSYLVALRAVNTRDFMTAEVTNLPWMTLDEASEEILQDSTDVSGVYYDITPKPPATVEFE